MRRSWGGCREHLGRRRRFVAEPLEQRLALSAAPLPFTPPTVFLGPLIAESIERPASIQLSMHGDARALAIGTVDLRSFASFGAEFAPPPAAVFHRVALEVHTPSSELPEGGRGWASPTLFAAAPAFRFGQPDFQFAELRATDAPEHLRPVADWGGIAILLDHRDFMVDGVNLVDFPLPVFRFGTGLRGRAEVEQAGASGEQETRPASGFVFNPNSNSSGDDHPLNVGLPLIASLLPRPAATTAAASDPTAVLQAPAPDRLLSVSTAVDGAIGEDPSAAAERVADVDSKPSGDSKSAETSHSTLPGGGVARGHLDPGRLGYLISTMLSVANGSPGILGGVVGAQVAGGAGLLAHMALDTAALDQAIAGVAQEVDRLGGELVSWLGDENVQPWMEGIAAAVAVGLGGVIVARRRSRSLTPEETAAESSTWIFTQLQHTAG